MKNTESDYVPKEGDIVGSRDEGCCFITQRAGGYYGELFERPASWEVSRILDEKKINENDNTKVLLGLSLARVDAEYVSKQKIRDKMKELDCLIEKDKDMGMVTMYQYAKNWIEGLLK